ncbi:MAG: STAS domain-containing protein [Phycisphaerales bacterium]
MMLTVEPVVDTASAPGVVVARLRGSADIHSDKALEQGLSGVMRPGTRVVVLDMGDVDILTSMAIGVLVGFRTRVMAGGGRVAFARVPEIIVKTMKFTRVSELFAQYPTVAEAVTREAAKR